MTVLVAVAASSLAAPATVHATFPGENGMIAYTHSMTEPETGDLGPPQIWVVNPDGSDQRQLTHMANAAYQPAWSPDGRTMAFVSPAPLLPLGDAIWIMDVYGGEVRQVTPGTGSFGNPAFSPDGQTLAMQGTIELDSGEEGGGSKLVSGIFAIDVDGSNLRPLRPGGRDPSWSPDGRKIAFDESVAAASQIMVMNADGTNPLQLTHTFRFHGRSDWTPDGRIAYIGNEFGDQAGAVYVIGPDGTGQERIHNNPPGGDTESVSWSPDGSRLVFSTYLGPGGGAPFTYRLHSVAANGSEEFEVTTDAEADAQPAWQPAVTDPAVLLEELLDQLTQSGAPNGTVKSLQEKLGVIQSQSAEGQIDAACGTLNAFLNQLNAQSGKSLPADLAEQLIEAATELEQSLEC